MEKKWFNKTVQEVEKELGTSADKGLNQNQVEESAKKYGLNELQEKKKDSLLKKFIEQFKDFSIIVLIIAAIVSGIVGVVEGEGITDTIIILIVVFLNAIIGIIQESKAEKSLEALKKLSSHAAKVIRNGKEQVIPARELVPGDLVVIETGDYVAADLRIIEAINLKSQESSLTGESVPVEKTTEKIDGQEIGLGDRKNMLFSSSLITYGRGKAIVVDTGMNTEVGKIAGMLDQAEKQETPLQKRLNSLGKTLGIACLAICAAIFAIGLIQGKPIIDMFMTAVSLAVAVIPEGLVAVSTIVLAIGVQKMVKKNAIVKKLPAVETLGSSTVICSDKTGTLTQNKMTVERVFCDDELQDIKNINKTEDFKKLVYNCMLCNDSRVLENGEIGGDPTETALVDMAFKQKYTQEIFKEKGSNAWFEMDTKDLLPEGAKCSCGHDKFVKETDIMDVWFDSGTTYAGVLEERGLPLADMYLEGSDQYRGWFQSSLLTCVATRGKAPYKEVLTHGFIIDEQGRKMSKSLGNGINPQDVINEYGADILRLWVLSSDFKSDVSISKNILKQITEVFRKIRNTARYILGNISDFDVNNLVEYKDLEEIDKWALSRLYKLIKSTTKSFDEYEFHMAYHDINQFCVSDMSNFYLDIIKDRLYTYKADSKERRAAQTTMYIILDSLVRILAPMICYTSEEIWSYMPHKKEENKESVMLAYWPELNEEYNNKQIEEKWKKIIDIKEEVARKLEIARKDKVIGNSLNARVIIHADSDNAKFLNDNKNILLQVFIVSGLEIIEDGKKDDENKLNIFVEVETAKGQKCERCWMYSETVGEDEENPTICHRCIENLK